MNQSKMIPSGLLLIFVSAILVGFGSNAAASLFVAPLALDNLGPLALVWHDRHPSLLLVAAVPALALFWVGRDVGTPVRILGAVFAGAVVANTISSIAWSAGIPDYIVIRRFDLICNVSDVLIVATALSIVAMLAFRKIRPEPA